MIACFKMGRVFFAGRPLKVYVFQDEGKSTRSPAINRSRPNTINLGQELRAQRVSGRVSICK